MASIVISATLPRACNSTHITTRNQQPVPRVARSLGTLNVEGQQSSNETEKLVQQQQQHKSFDSHVGKQNNTAGNEATNDVSEQEFTGVKFADVRWKNGTWDLNKFVDDGRMDWDGLIVAEAKRRKFLELYPEASTNEDPVLFKSSIIPWWAWIKRSYLPEAELLNGRAAMVGFFMAYVVDGLTGLDMVGQTGNFVCKAGLFLTVVGTILFRKTDDFDNFKKLANEVTLYDKQWQSSWQDQEKSI